MMAEMREEMMAKGCHLPPVKPASERFDSNCITPVCCCPSCHAVLITETARIHRFCMGLLMLWLAFFASFVGGGNLESA